MRTELHADLLTTERKSPSVLRASVGSTSGLARAASPSGEPGALPGPSVGSSLSSAPAPLEPPALAPRPPLEALGQRRDAARLLVASRSTGRLNEGQMSDLDRFLEPGDVVVVNTSATLPAAIDVDEDIAVHLSTQLEPDHGDAPTSRWVVELRRRAGHGSLPWLGYRPDGAIDLPGGGWLEILRPYLPAGRRMAADAIRLWEAQLTVPGKPLAYLAKHGHPIRYGAEAGDWPLDAYQTVFATEPGSAEMPSAARGFTPELVTKLVSREIAVVPIVLHTGVASPEVHEPPYPERFRVPVATATAVNAARASGHRVVAVGTTVTRALESAADPGGKVHPHQGWTDLVITPERGAWVVDGLITGWHDPEASHLLLVEAIAGRDLLDRSYAAAVAAGFSGHEFGDFHLILP